ncbi:ATP-binding protein [Parasphingorhabdus sp.]
MRDLGYSLETAVADLIDNSISAKSEFIQVFCDTASRQPTLAIIDDGRGMDSEEILIAMRHGSVNPRQERSADDLGRFGLGLKTASFSQCRQMTLVSSKKGKFVAAEWNLDLVDQEDDWLISILEEDEISELPFVDQIVGDGTLVLWRNLDRLFEDETGGKRAEIVNEKLDILEKHLALVFHRYLSGDVRGWKKISIAVNGHNVEPFDPFCRRNPATQVLPEEIVRIDRTEVRLQPYILPHHSKLTAKEYDYYQNRSDFLSNQGAYVYRNGRLMAWGDWFRLVPKGEATKLARVQIDFPNSLDERWTIDIKKSRARPPHPVRERLRQIITRITGRSTTVHRGRGKRLFEETSAPLWERYAEKGTIRYSLNSEHPLILSLSASLDTDGRKAVETLIDAVASSLPVEMIYSDFSTNPKDIDQSQLKVEDILERLSILKKIMFAESIFNSDDFRDVVKSTRMFHENKDVVENFIARELE